MSLDVYLYEDAEEQNCLFSANITHNLGRMASEAGIYEVLWRPEELLDLEMAAVINDAESEAWDLREADPKRAQSLWAKADDIRRQLPRAHARDLIEPIERGLILLKSDRARFEAFNATNGWGLHEHFVPWVEKYLEACKQYPNAKVRVSR